LNPSTKKKGKSWRRLPFHVLGSNGLQRVTNQGQCDSPSYSLGTSRNDWKPGGVEKVTCNSLGEWGRRCGRGGKDTSRKGSFMRPTNDADSQKGTEIYEKRRTRQRLGRHLAIYGKEDRKKR